MHSRLLRLAVSSAALMPLWLAAAEAEPARRFAAPDAAAKLSGSSAGGIGQVTVALLLVLAVVFALAFALKKMRAVTGGGVNGIEVLAQTSLGAKERAVLVRVEGSRLLLGVASGQVTLLQVLPASPVDTQPPATKGDATRPSFGQLLRKSLGR
jgi:flagellar protein FliO/FliZ